jgi:RNA polymerase sigma-70 factor (ECF subfamily)
MDSEKTEMSSVKGEENMTFEELCVKMQSKLKKYIYHKTKNIHRTEDILQNVFFTAVKKRNEVLSHPKPEGWLFNAARNLVLKDYEKNKRIEENEVELLDVMVAEESFGE